MSHTVIVPNHEQIRNFLQQHRLPLYFSKPVLQHITDYTYFMLDMFFIFFSES